MKRLFILLLTTVSLLSCKKNPDGGEGTLTYPAKVPAKEDIPILAWHSIPGEFTTDAMYQEMRDAGFTLTYTNYRGGNEYLKPALDAAQKAGIKIFLRCYDIEDGDKAKRQAVVNQYKDHPALAGWFLWDEPVNKDILDAMATWRKDIIEIDKAHPCYANLLPDLGDNIFKAMGLTDYEGYLDYYRDNLHPQFYSAAYYPIVKNLDGVVYIAEDQWFPTLQKMSLKSKRDNIPFWSFALSTGHTPLHDVNRPLEIIKNYDDHFPVPTIAHLRLQMWNNLVYGSQVLQYFTYWTPTSAKDTKYEYWYGGGPKLMNGETGPAYPIVKQMNEEIQQLSGVFNGSKMTKVRHTGEKIPAGTYLFEQADLPAEMKSLTTSQGATVSLFENQGFKFLAVVSRTLDGDNTVTMVPASENVKRVMKDSSIVDLAADGKYTVTPGDILIFVYDGPR